MTARRPSRSDRKNDLISHRSDIQPFQHSIATSILIIFLYLEQGLFCSEILSEITVRTNTSGSGTTRAEAVRSVAEMHTTQD